MTAHKHAEMIKAKADNMELVVFCKNSQNDGEWWAFKNDGETIPSFNGKGTQYFACLPKHNENGQCLHWLNGSAMQFKDSFGDWRDCSEYNPETSVKMLIDNDDEFRIKPSKEKRWIGYCANRNQTFPHPQDTKQLAIDYALRNYSYIEDEWQFIEIEVEVTK